MTIDVGLTHVALEVTDVDRSVAFYGAYCGMEIVHRRGDDKGGDVAWISDRTRPFVVVLIRVDVVERPLGPWSHLGTACASREEVDRLCGRAREVGVLESGPTDSGPPVGYWAFLRDPDGHILEVSFGQEVGATVEHSPGPA